MITWANSFASKGVLKVNDKMYWWSGRIGIAMKSKVHLRSEERPSYGEKKADTVLEIDQVGIREPAQIRQVGNHITRDLKVQHSTSVVLGLPVQLLLAQCNNILSHQEEMPQLSAVQVVLSCALMQYHSRLAKTNCRAPLRRIGVKDLSQRQQVWKSQSQTGGYRHRQRPQTCFQSICHKVK